MLSTVICFSQNALNSDSSEPSTVIPTKSLRNSTKSEKLAGIRQTLFSDTMLPAKEIFSDEFRLTKIKGKERKKKKKSLPVFAGITVDDILGKKIKNA
jgi:hypothetical protein